MTDRAWDAQGEAQTALHTLVNDQRYGPSTLSNPQTMTYVLQHMLPNLPQESSALVAAASAGVPGMLQYHLSQGADMSTAQRLTAQALASQSTMSPEACAWAAGAMASALRLEARDARSWGATQQAGSQQAGSQAAQQAGPQQAGAYGYGQQAAGPGPGPGAGPGFGLGAGPGGWPGQPPVVSRPRPNGMRIAGAIAAVLGAGLIVWACALPDIRVTSGNSTESFSIFNSGSGGTLWFAVEPIGVAALGIAGAVLILLIARSARLRLIAAGVLAGLGIQTVLLFAGYEFSVRSPEHAGPAGITGIIGGLALLAAGLLVASGREQPTTT